MARKPGKLALFLAAFILFTGKAFAGDYVQGRIRLVINEKTGRFTVYCRPDLETETFYPMLWDRDQYRTTSITVLMDEKPHTLGDSHTFKTYSTGTFDAPALSFESKDISILQKFSFTKTAISAGETNAVRIDIKVQNRSPTPHEIGLRFLLDTFLGEKSTVHFSTDAREIRGETIAEPVSGETRWITRNRKYGVMGTMFLEDIFQPDSVEFANWKRLSEAKFKPTYRSDRSFTKMPFSIKDSAVCYFLDPKMMSQYDERMLTVILGMEDPYGFDSPKLDPLYDGPLPPAVPIDQESQTNNGKGGITINNNQVQGTTSAAVQGGRNGRDNGNLEMNSQWPNGQPPYAIQQLSIQAPQYSAPSQTQTPPQYSAPSQTPQQNSDPQQTQTPQPYSAPQLSQQTQDYQEYLKNTHPFYTNNYPGAPVPSPNGYPAQNGSNYPPQNGYQQPQNGNLPQSNYTQNVYPPVYPQSVYPPVYPQSVYPPVYPQTVYPPYGYAYPPQVVIPQYQERSSRRREDDAQQQPTIIINVPESKPATESKPAVEPEQPKKQQATTGPLPVAQGAIKIDVASLRAIINKIDNYVYYNIPMTEEEVRSMEELIMQLRTRYSSIIGVSPTPYSR